VLLSNEAPTAASGRLNLPALAGHRWAARIFDPEHNRFSPTVPEANPDGTIGPIAIEPHSELIVIAAPIAEPRGQPGAPTPASHAEPSKADRVRR